MLFTSFERRLKTLSPFFIAVLLVVFCFGMWTAWLYKSIRTFSGVARCLFGYKLVLSSAAIDVGQVVAGEDIDATVRLYNNSFTPVRFIGDSATCKCLSVTRVDAIGGCKSVDIELKMTIPSRPGSFTQQVCLFTDMRGYEKICLSISGHVKSSL